MVTPTDDIVDGGGGPTQKLTIQGGVLYLHLTDPGSLLGGSDTRGDLVELVVVVEVGKQ